MKINIIDILIHFGRELNTIEDKEEIVIILYAISLQQYLPVENKPEECNDVQWDDYRFCYSLMRCDTVEKVNEIFRDLCQKWNWEYIDYFINRSTWHFKLKAYVLRQDSEYTRHYPIIHSILKYLWKNL